jgi:hypothetical protein
LAVAQIGGVGHVGHGGVTVLVSGTGGGKMTMYVVSHTPFLHATTHVFTVVVCEPFGVNTTQPDAFGPVNVPIVEGTNGQAV